MYCIVVVLWLRPKLLLRRHHDVRGSLQSTPVQKMIAPPYSGSILASATIFRHFPISAIMNALSSSGELATGSMPVARSFGATYGSASALRIAAVRALTTGFGVLAGAKAANHAVR